MRTVIGWGCAWYLHAVVGKGWAFKEILNSLLGPKSRSAVCEYCVLFSLLLHSRLQTPTGRARCQKPEGPSREDSPVRKEKILERKYNNDKTKQQQQKV